MIGSMSLLKPKLWRENKIEGRKENGDTALFSTTAGFSPGSVSKNPTMEKYCAQRFMGKSLCQGNGH